MPWRTRIRNGQSATCVTRLQHGNPWMRLDVDVTAACPSLRQHPLLAGSHLDACADSLLLTTPQQFDWMAGRCAFGVCETGVTMEGRD